MSDNVKFISEIERLLKQKQNDSIEKDFESQQQSIKKNGGQNVRQW